jgi:beta-N-acetylhexosaminidase
MMDTPYLLGEARSPTLIATYSSSALSLTALANVLAGKAKAPGRSPVAVNGLPRSAC